MPRSSFSDQPRSGFLSHFLRASKSRNTKRRKGTGRAFDRRSIFRFQFRPLTFALIIVAGTAMIVVTLILARMTGNDDVDPTHKNLELTAQDIDPETTATEKNLLKE